MVLMDGCHHDRTRAVIEHARKMRERIETREVVPPTIQAQLDAHQRDIVLLVEQLVKAQHELAQIKADMEAFIQAAVAAAVAPRRDNAEGVAHAPSAD